MPFLASSFLAIRKLCKLPVESFFTGGASWFKDLTVADPYMALPVIATLTTMTMIYVSC
jgi:YidC/Oxa1 family membrane protein insertase